MRRWGALRGFTITPRERPRRAGAAGGADIDSIGGTEGLRSIAKGSARGDELAKANGSLGGATAIVVLKCGIRRAREWVRAVRLVSEIQKYVVGPMFLETGGNHVPETSSSRRPEVVVVEDT